MPELPEVETIVRELRPRLKGRRVTAADVLHARIVRHSDIDLRDWLPGARIIDVLRHGKFILLQLDKGWLTVHLGMTGQLRFEAPETVYTRAVLQLDDSSLLYDDIRMFGSIEAGRKRIDQLGPDALARDEWHVRLLRHKAPIKAVLLNQRVVAGIGNIYADEALFRAAIHPATVARRLSKARANKLEQLTRDLLNEAIDFRGSSISDYVDTEGRRGGFQERHQAYGREGKPCVRCASPIEKSFLAQRGTHFCPNCQRR
jgi:formamidopyrimidine-DNA glycosylase